MNTKNRYSYPAITIDITLFAYNKKDLSVLLIKRKKEPYNDTWTVPGGFVQPEETFETTCKRILKQKAGIENLYLEQLFTFDSLDRDPRGRVLSVAYYGLVNSQNINLIADKTSIDWFPIKELPTLGFDHQQIINVAFQRLQSKVMYKPIGFELLEKKFTLSSLQHLYECILNIEINKRNFRKRILDTGILVATGQHLEGLKHRPPELYEFDEIIYNQLTTSNDFHFKVHLK